MSSHNNILSILFCVLLGAAGQILLKVGASNPALVAHLGSGNLMGFATRALVSPAVLAGFVLYAASAALWMVVLARSELSFAYPFISLGFVITATYGWLALNESLSLVRVAGIAMIILGVLLVSRS
jgi:drug/metabolite transporter (DMT)-like permease